MEYEINFAILCPISFDYEEDGVEVWINSTFEDSGLEVNEDTVTDAIIEYIFARMYEEFRPSVADELFEEYHEPIMVIVHSFAEQYMNNKEN